MPVTLEVSKDIFKGVDLAAAQAEADEIIKLPKTITLSRDPEHPKPNDPKFPTILTGPFTRAGRYIAMNKELREFTLKFIRLGNKNRNWEPEDVVPMSEVALITKNISEEQFILLKKINSVFWQTELQTEAYVDHGLKVSKNSNSVRGVIRWGSDEIKHNILLGDAMVAMGMMTEAERLAKEAEAMSEDKNRWHAYDHEGLEEYEWAYIFFGRKQEKDTKENYFLKRLFERALMGLPPEMTPEEVILKREFGISEVDRKIAPDEAAHELFYDGQGRILHHFFPEEAHDAMGAASRHYHLPMVRQIMESEEVSSLLYPSNKNMREAYAKTSRAALKTVGLHKPYSALTLKESIKSLSNTPAKGIHVISPDGKLYKPETAQDEYSQLISLYDAMMQKKAA